MVLLSLNLAYSTFKATEFLLISTFDAVKIFVSPAKILFAGGIYQIINYAYAKSIDVVPSKNQALCEYCIHVS